MNHHPHFMMTPAMNHLASSNSSSSPDLYNNEHPINNVNYNNNNQNNSLYNHHHQYHSSSTANVMSMGSPKTYAKHHHHHRQLPSVHQIMNQMNISPSHAASSSPSYHSPNASHQNSPKNFWDNTPTLMVTNNDDVVVVEQCNVDLSSTLSANHQQIDVDVEPVPDTTNVNQFQMSSSVHVVPQNEELLTIGYGASRPESDDGDVIEDDKPHPQRPRSSSHIPMPISSPKLMNHYATDIDYYHRHHPHAMFRIDEQLPFNLNNRDQQLHRSFRPHRIQPQINHLGQVFRSKTQQQNTNSSSPLMSRRHSSAVVRSSDGSDPIGCYQRDSSPMRNNRNNGHQHSAFFSNLNHNPHHHQQQHQYHRNKQLNPVISDDNRRRSIAVTMISSSGDNNNGGGVSAPLTASAVTTTGAIVTSTTGSINSNNNNNINVNNNNCNAMTNGGGVVVVAGNNGPTNSQLLLQQQSAIVSSTITTLPTISSQMDQRRPSMVSFVTQPENIHHQHCSSFIDHSGAIVSSSTSSLTQSSSHSSSNASPIRNNRRKTSSTSYNNNNNSVNNNLDHRNSIVNQEQSSIIIDDQELIALSPEEEEVDLPEDNNLILIDQSNGGQNNLHVPNGLAGLSVVRHHLGSVEEEEPDLDNEDIIEEEEDDDDNLFQSHLPVRRHRSLPAPTFVTASSSLHSMALHPQHRKSSSFRIRNNNNRIIQEPNGRWRIQVKKTKSFLGIAIEGGSNVSTQSQPRIINIQDGGAAAGSLHVGHIILEVDGETTQMMNHEQVAQMIARAYYNTPQKDYVEFLVREKSRNEFDLRRSSFMLLNSSFE